MSNERGITISSNIGTIDEIIIYNRARPQITISEAQTGGRKGRATTDNLLILKDTISNEKRRNHAYMYMVFLDVIKAYDKACLDSLLYVLNKRGIKSINTVEWQVINDLNTNLKAEVKTKHGNIRKIRDSSGQGGILSVLIYATAMDEIAE